MGHVIGFLPASGGVGATTLAAALAVRAVQAERTAVAVDLDSLRGLGGRLDVACGVEQEPGWRWDRLVDVDGIVDGRGLARELPEAFGVPVLSGVGLPVERWATVLPDVVAGLARVHDVTVLDLPRDERIISAVGGMLDALVVVAGTQVPQLAAAATTLPAVREVLRGAAWMGAANAVGDPAPVGAAPVVRAQAGAYPEGDSAWRSGPEAASLERAAGAVGRAGTAGTVRAVGTAASTGGSGTESAAFGSVTAAAAVKARGAAVVPAGRPGPRKRPWVGVDDRGPERVPLARPAEPVGRAGQAEPVGRVGLAELADLIEPWVVLRGARADAEIEDLVSDQLDVAVLGFVRDDPRVPSDVADGIAPGVRGRGPVVDVADRLLLRLVARWVAA